MAGDAAGSRFGDGLGVEDGIGAPLAVAVTGTVDANLLVNHDVVYMNARGLQLPRHALGQAKFSYVEVVRLEPPRRLAVLSISGQRT